LFIGFHLDDFIGRFIYSDLPGAERLYGIYAGGYGTANGDPVDAAWMMEEGYAPWWMDPHLLLMLFRPVSLATHLIDAKLSDSAFLWHAHSLLWYGALILAATRTYRGIQGNVIGGLAALLYAVDHTHGFAVSWITNRHTLVATTFALLALDQHHRFRGGGDRRAAWLAPALYGLALLSGESSAAIMGYVFAYAVFIDSGTLWRRALTLAPYLVTTMAWRALYSALGRGARGSGLYTDPGREPLQFLAAVIERAPMLLLGQWFAPPAETTGGEGQLYMVVNDWTALAIGAFAWLFAITLFLALWPLLRRDKYARFWAAGMVLAIIPACSVDPNNRLLFFPGIGAMGLLARWWHFYAVELRAGVRSWSEKLSRGYGGLMLLGHLYVSPLVLPITASSLLLMSPLRRSFADVGAEVAGREAVFITAPDYYVVRLMRMTKEVDGEPTARRWRILAYGPERVTVHRPTDRTLILDYEGGAMTQPALDLYRNREAPMRKGQKVSLKGLAIEVLEVTSDGRPLRARFDFAESLDSSSYRFYHWADNHFRPFVVPEIGGRRALPPAVFIPELPD
jgi:hypothetical protein